MAVATSPGEGAIGIVRLSGPQAISMAERFFRGPKPLRDFPNRKLMKGRFVINGQDLDEILAVVMKAPFSYTGEDIVELNFHGGPLILRRVTQAFIGEGVRGAERGEFTKRAFLNGKMDLTQAESVADLISAKADMGLKSAFFQFRGGLRDRIGLVTEYLKKSITILEASLDFPEDVEINLLEIDQFIGKGWDEIKSLISSYEQGKVVRNGALVTLAGRPNVGKSTLLNRMLEEDRAIVTSIPGTTRDTIEELIDLDGLQVTLVDTAGLRRTNDPIELQGTRRSYSFINKSDLVLVLVDGSSSPCKEDIDFIKKFQGLPSILVFNKMDLGCNANWRSHACSSNSVGISGLTGEGIASLRRKIRDSVLGRESFQAEGITHERHLVCLKQALECLARAKEAIESDAPYEIISLEIRCVLDALGEIGGKTTAQEILNRVFQNFCIGK